MSERKKGCWQKVETANEKLEKRRAPRRVEVSKGIISPDYFEPEGKNRLN